MWYLVLNMFEAFYEYRNEYKINVNLLFYMSSVHCTIPNVYAKHRQIVKCVQNKVEEQYKENILCLYSM